MLRNPKTRGICRRDGEQYYIDILAGSLGCVIWGPYEPLDPGRYIVTFNIHVINYDSIDDICCYVEVAANLGSTVIVNKRLLVNDVNRNGGRIVIEFTLFESQQLEYRVFGSAFTSFCVAYYRAARPYDSAPTQSNTLYMDNFDTICSLRQQGYRFNSTNNDVIAQLGPTTLTLTCDSDFTSLASDTQAVREASRIALPDRRALTQSRRPLGTLLEESNGIFRSFERYSGPGQRGYITSFIGTKTRTNVVSNLDLWDGIVEGYPEEGALHGTPMEWAGTLKAVLEAKQSFRMFELGAGWGPWCAVGHKAARQREINDVFFVGVEGDPGHVRFMEDHFTVNGLSPKQYTIISGVVGTIDGNALFPRAKDPSNVYGGVPKFESSNFHALAFDEFINGSSEQIDDVQRTAAFSLHTLIERFSFLDLIHCDIQGGELELFSHSLDLVSMKVKRVVIGTHSWRIDHELIGLFSSRGWVLEGAEDCSMNADGTQVWRNPHLS